MSTSNPDLPRLRPIHRYSQYRGVSWSRKRRQWFAQRTLGLSEGCYTIGYFDDEIDAARAYDAEIRRIYGNDGLYNFPRESEKSVVCTCCG